MKKIIIFTTLICSLTLAGCATQKTELKPTSEPTPLTQKPATITANPTAEPAASSGNPQTDLNTIDQDLNSLDAATDFKTFNQTDLNP